MPVKPQGLLKKSDIALKTMLTIDMTIDECSVIIFQVLQMISVFLLSQTCFASNLSVKQKDKKVVTKSSTQTNKYIRPSIEAAKITMMLKSHFGDGISLDFSGLD